MINGATVPRNLSVASAQEYGFTLGEQANYQRAEDDPLSVSLYHMKDPSGAYGEYLYLCPPEMQRAELSELSVISREQALILIGNIVLDVRGIDLIKDVAGLKALVSAVSPHAQFGPLPALADHLPSHGIVSRSERYILGPQTMSQFLFVAPEDWLGFSKGAEAEFAQYRIEGRNLDFVIADFPTPQTAQKQLMELEQKYHVNRTAADQTGSPVFAKRSITLLAIVFGARNQAEADKLLEQVQSGAEVTWNEPTFQFKEPPLTTMIVGAIIGTGIICCFALISGIAFGGFRIVVKRFLPDKVFDRSSSMQVLQLGLGSKPINSEDFYGIERKLPK